LFSRRGAALLLLLKYKIVQCEISRISRNYFRRRPKFCCSADFRIAAFFLGDFRPAIIFRRIRLKFGGWGLCMRINRREPAQCGGGVVDP